MGNPVTGATVLFNKSRFRFLAPIAIMGFVLALFVPNAVQADDSPEGVVTNVKWEITDDGISELHGDDASNNGIAAPGNKVISKISFEVSNAKNAIVEIIFPGQSPWRFTSGSQGSFNVSNPHQGYTSERTSPATSANISLKISSAANADGVQYVVFDNLISEASKYEKHFGKSYTPTVRITDGNDIRLPFEFPDVLPILEGKLDSTVSMFTDTSMMTGENIVEYDFGKGLEPAVVREEMYFGVYAGQAYADMSDFEFDYRFETFSSTYDSPGNRTLIDNSDFFIEPVTYDGYPAQVHATKIGLDLWRIKIPEISGIGAAPFVKFYFPIRDYEIINVRAAAAETVESSVLSDFGRPVSITFNSLNRDTLMSLPPPLFIPSVVATVIDQFDNGIEFDQGGFQRGKKTLLHSLDRFSRINLQKVQNNFDGLTDTHILDPNSPSMVYEVFESNEKVSLQNIVAKKNWYKPESETAEQSRTYLIEGLDFDVYVTRHVGISFQNVRSDEIVWETKSDFIASGDDSSVLTAIRYDYVSEDYPISGTVKIDKSVNVYQGIHSYDGTNSAEMPYLQFSLGRELLDLDTRKYTAAIMMSRPGATTQENNAMRYSIMNFDVGVALFGWGSGFFQPSVHSSDGTELRGLDSISSTPVITSGEQFQVTGRTRFSLGVGDYLPGSHLPAQTFQIELPKAVTSVSLPEFRFAGKAGGLEKTNQGIRIADIQPRTSTHGMIVTLE